MVETILKFIIIQLLKALPEEQVKKAVDKALDALEDKIAESDTKLDDAIILPIIKTVIREPFGIEDND